MTVVNLGTLYGSHSLRVWSLNFSYIANKILEIRQQIFYHKRFPLFKDYNNLSVSIYSAYLFHQNSSTYIFVSLENVFVLVCDDGTFGYDCKNNCSGNCMNDSPCNTQTGHCDRGCKPGYTTENCSEGFNVFV